MQLIAKMLATVSLVLAAITAELASLVPETSAPPASYYTTWGTQGYLWGARRNFSLEAYVSNGTARSHDFLDYEHVFGPADCDSDDARVRGTCGWAARFHARARRDLFLVLDAGWAEEGRGTTGDQLNRTKWAPFFDNNTASDPGGSNAEALRRLNARAVAFGWRGAGLWFGSFGASTNVTRRALESKQAGVRYWKVDFCADARQPSPSADCASDPRCPTEFEAEAQVSRAPCRTGGARRARPRGP